MQEETQQGQPSAADLDTVAAEQTAAAATAQTTEATEQSTGDEPAAAQTTEATEKSTGEQGATDATTSDAIAGIPDAKAEFGKVETDPATGEQRQQVHIQFPLGDVIRHHVKEELHKILEHLSVEPPADAFARLEDRVKGLEEELEAAGLKARKVVLDEVAEVANEAGQAIGEAKFNNG